MIISTKTTNKDEDEHENVQDKANKNEVSTSKNNNELIFTDAPDNGTSKLKSSAAVEITSGAATTGNINPRSADAVAIGTVHMVMLNPRDPTAVEIAPKSTANIAKLKPGAAAAVEIASRVATAVYIIP